MPEQILQSRRVVTPEGTRPAAVVVKDGVITELGGYDPKADSTDYGNQVIMAGLVDTHVHVNEPGRTEWEGFESATAAAAAGGITTIVDMPLNCIPVTTSAKALKTKLKAASGLCRVDTGFWGGVVPGNAGELEAMIEAGALGFKCFLIHSGIDDFPAAAEADLRRAMPILAERGAPLLVHAELESQAPAPKGTGYSDYLRSRPQRWENEAVALMIRLCRETGCRVHIVHLSSAGALDQILKARQEKLPLTVETCPHYLTFAAEAVKAGATEFKCAPPIREAKNREGLWAALGAGGPIDFIVSDHSPCAPELKVRESGDFGKAWGGIAGLQFTLCAVWTQASRRGRSTDDLALWLCERPAKFAGLARKGRVAPGFDADLVVWNPEASFKVAPELILHKHKVTPYAGQTLKGTVTATYLRGNKIFEKGRVLGAARGRFLLDSDRRLAAR